MHFFHKLLTERFPNLLGIFKHLSTLQIDTDFILDFNKEITHVELGSRIPLPQLLLDINDLKANLEIAQNELQHAKQYQLPEDKFIPTMTISLLLKIFKSFKIMFFLIKIVYEFLITAKEELSKTMFRMEKVKGRFAALLQWFGEDPQTLPEELFGTWLKFILAFEVFKKKVRSF